VKKLGAYFFLLFIFLGSTHITINQHLCNGELESTAFFVEAQPCEHASAQDDLPPCHKKADKKKCCSTNQIKIEAVDWFQFIDVAHDIKPTTNGFASFIAPLAQSQIPMFLKEDFSLKRIFSPPIFKEDIYIWDESYLI
jgi:hypothetical protein